MSMYTMSQSCVLRVSHGDIDVETNEFFLVFRFLWDYKCNRKDVFLSDPYVHVDVYKIYLAEVGQAYFWIRG